MARSWVRWPDEKLLDLRLRDLDVSLASPFLRTCISQVLDELDRKGIRFRPHFWMSSEWFTPDGVPGCAVPFFLAHPRLMRLERRQMLEVEGGTHKSCLKILRHEVGHAIDHAYRLHDRRKWREVFGKSSKPYPEFYQPWPFSRRHVLHLDYWYAQAHPDEDFAETFAVWLRPRSGWRRRYQGWPAMRKLEYVDALMTEIAGKEPEARRRTMHEPLSRIRKTLREHYAAKQQRYEREYPSFYDHDLRRLFSAAPDHAHNESAASFLRRIRGEVRRRVSRWTGEYQYTLDLVLADMISRCRELNLHIARPARRTKTDVCILLTMQTMNYLHTGRHRVTM
ncbi:MAG TPA: putative zinc-binding metallopeptidase [Phycisphaerae bacterium]|nr:putative zinc-binding metallopeptidase [Phycisphaerae bacterium]